MKFLRKLFIKNYENVNDEKVREKHGILASICGIVINLILFIFKILIGILSLSMSIISDAINNLTDLFSCFVTMFGFKMAARPPDRRHPYGHQRIEYISGMIIAFVIVSVAIILGYTSISNLINKSILPKYDIYAFIVLSVSILMKVLLGFIYRGLGKAINSESLKASMIDSLNDSICTAGVLIAAIVNYFVDVWWLDSTIALLISLFILYSGIKQIIETASPLIGTPVEPELVKAIQEMVLSHEGILGVHDFICHSYGHTKYFATIHCEVDGYGNMIEIHDKIDNIEQEVKEKLGVELTIHMDPVDTKNKELPILKEKISTIVKEIECGLSIHDLRIVSGPTHTNILFDLVKDPDCKLEDDELIKLVTLRVEELDNTYNVIINLDHKY